MNYIEEILRLKEERNAIIVAHLYQDGDIQDIADMVGDSFDFIRENMDVTVLSCKGSVFGVEPPTFVELLITHCEPGVRGDTANNATKPATLETGATIKVPLFVNEGETIRVDTRTGEYMSRV